MHEKYFLYMACTTIFIIYVGTKSTLRVQNKRGGDVRPEKVLYIGREFKKKKLRHYRSHLGFFLLVYSFVNKTAYNVWVVEGGICGRCLVHWWGKVVVLVVGEHG